MLHVNLRNQRPTARSLPDHDRVRPTNESDDDATRIPLCEMRHDAERTNRMAATGHLPASSQGRADNVHGTMHAQGPNHPTSSFSDMVEKRMWGSMTPLRQFPKVPAEVIRKAEPEGKQFAWYRCFDLSPPEICELLGLPKDRRVHRLVHTFPKLHSNWRLVNETTIVPDFQWDPEIHGGDKSFHILVEDIDGEVILFHDIFVLRQRYAHDEQNVTITVCSSPFPPTTISLLSPTAGCTPSETRLPNSTKHIILPEDFPPPTPLLDLQPLPLTALQNKEFESISPTLLTLATTHIRAVSTQSIPRQ
ncbi:hypothetical protein D9611_003077 [Ephemerocybe angulata]|uniref:SEC63 domain-containing protein n=1 Tax=Ephemerocybe angulata TaxID=980116 RepID=A0A8H5C9V2_9AGAR|nr:hypothetical protein D9611_003077 [Tulosesus angulatus]